MTREEFKAGMAMLVSAFSVKTEDMPDVRKSAYWDALNDIPAPLFNAAVRRANKSRTWFPKPSELRADAELERKALLAAHPYEGCASCEDSRGLIEVEDADGIKRARFCPCKQRWREKLAQLGIGATERIALPPARHWTEPEDAA